MIDMNEHIKYLNLAVTEARRIENEIFKGFFDKKTDHLHKKEEFQNVL